ncbi:unnamed protein product [Diplocarpon coronariae]
MTRAEASKLAGCNHSMPSSGTNLFRIVADWLDVQWVQSSQVHERAPFSRRLRAPRDDMRLERTPLTRRQSVIGISLHLEPESANFEAAFRDLLPDIDLNTLIELPPEESSQENPDRDNFESRQVQQVLYLARDETRESRSSAPEQMLPLQVDGLDCAEERTLTGLSDGATALSIKPWGNGYLGQATSLIPIIFLITMSTSPSATSWHDNLRITMNLFLGVADRSRLAELCLAAIDGIYAPVLNASEPEKMLQHSDLFSDVQSMFLNAQGDGAEFIERTNLGLQ